MELPCWRGMATFKHVQEPARPFLTNTDGRAASQSRNLCQEGEPAVCHLPGPCQNRVQVTFLGDKTLAQCPRKGLQ